MPVTHKDMMARLPKVRQAHIKARAAEFHREIESLKVPLDCFVPLAATED
jgi:hypothetical protein